MIDKHDEECYRRKAEHGGQWYCTCDMTDDQVQAQIAHLERIEATVREMVD